MGMSNFNQNVFTEGDLLTVAKYVAEFKPVHMTTAVLKRKDRVIKEVVFECSNDKRYVADINQKPIKFIECNVLRTIERKCKRTSGHGEYSYRGNADSDVFKKAINYIFKKLNKEKHIDKIIVADFMEGSGTSRDLCKTLNFVHYVGNDLRYGFNRITDESNVRPDIEILHPPYFVAKSEKTGKLSNMPQYGGVQWKNDKVDLSFDGSHIHNWEEYVRWNNKLLARAMLNLPVGGRIIYMNAPVKFENKYYDIFKDMDIYGELEQVIIKEQYNTFSDNIQYTGEFIPIVYEYVLIIKKTSSLKVACKVVRNQVIDLMQSVKITWKELVQSVSEHLGGVVTEKKVVEFLRENKHPKLENNNFPERKVSQIFTTFKDIYECVDKGVYVLKSASDVANSVSLVSAI
jgi:hypothetical protein